MEKKTVVATERDSERVKALRQAFLAYQPKIDAGRTFFIDETGSTIAMVRDHARAPRGERVHDSAPRNFGDVVTVIGALTVEGITALMTIRGGTTKDVFASYVEEVLAPELEPGDVVVLDNLAAHKDPRVREMIEAHGAKLIFLPPYSPDLNPIEIAWSWLKRWLKSARARTEDSINIALAMALDIVDADMASAWIRHCGYQAQCG